MPKSKCLHVLGAGQWQVPTIRLAKSLGHRVVCTDVFADRPGYANADAHAVIDIADKEATLRFAAECRIDGIVCDTTDVGVPTMAYVAEELGLPGIGYETALNFTNKHRMRVVTSAAGVPNPPFRLVRDAEDLDRAQAEIGLPLVLKPVDNQSSRGVHVVRERAGLREAYRDARRQSRAGQVIAEGFLEGVEVTVEGYRFGGEVLVAGISDKDHFAHRREVANRLTYPADLPAATLARIRDVNARAVDALGLRSGITHAEYIVAGSEVYLVEVAARGGGSRIYSDIVPYLSGVPVPELYIEHVLGGCPKSCPDGTARAANLAFFSFPPGRVKRVRGAEEAAALPGVHELLLEFGPGDVLRPPLDDRSRPGLVVVFGRTRSEVLEVTQEVFEMVRVDVE
jgi:carbamoyl-phosphate synthase large subunit